MGWVTAPVFWKHTDENFLAEKAVNVVLILSVVESMKYTLCLHLQDEVIQLHSSLFTIMVAESTENYK